ncbi:MAG: hypothetical protein M4D80_21810 [Myxococcota bacterium]|nr:hypothetical protein [Deltaproteobacteria bacterium]MDQ3337805.1 hypothetical protein [Myxococcota bacterium]
MTRLLPLLIVLGACAVDGNTISGSWTVANGGHGTGANPGECITFLGSSVSIKILSQGQTIASTQVPCDDGGFDITISTDVTTATVEAKDGGSETWRKELANIDGNRNVGTIFFDHD